MSTSFIQSRSDRALPETAIVKGGQFFGSPILSHVIRIMSGGGEVLTHHQHRLSTAAITPNILVQTRNGEMPENADDYMMMKDEWALI